MTKIDEDLKEDDARSRYTYPPASRDDPDEGLKTEMRLTWNNRAKVYDTPKDQEKPMPTDKKQAIKDDERRLQAHKWIHINGGFLIDREQLLARRAKGIKIKPTPYKFITPDPAYEGDSKGASVGTFTAIC